jgi:hypothetical protein
MWPGVVRAAFVFAIVFASGCDNPPASPASPTRPGVVPAEGPRLESRILGEYTLTFTASDSCVLPPEARQRSYTATMAESVPGSVTVLLGGADFAGWGTGGAPRAVQGTLNADRLQFGVFVGERVNREEEICYSGTATAALGATGMSGTFSGQIWLNRAGDLYDVIADCTAADHRVDFVPR